MESFRVRSNLISHVVDNGFPIGFSKNQNNTESKKDQYSDVDN